MAERRRGLGRGLGALIPSAPTAEAGPAPDEPTHPKTETAVAGPADTATESTPQHKPTETAAARSTSSGTKTAPAKSKESDGASAAAATSDAETSSPVEQGDAEATTQNPEPPPLDLQGASGVDSGSPAAPTAPVDDAAGTENTDDVARETPPPRRRAVSTDARQKAMRSRMDVGATLRHRGGVDRPSDMFFSPSSASGDSPNEAPEKSEATATSSTTRSDREVPRETKLKSTDAAPAPTAPTADAGAEPVAEAQRGAADGSAHGADDLAAVPGAVFAEVDVEDIHPNRKQPRQVFDEDELAELAYSIGELGVLQPIVVRPSRETAGPKHELVMGERRWRATQRAGLPTIPAIVRETADDELLRDALLENLHRSQLNPLEEAAAYQQLLEEFGATQEELSRRIGRSRPQISNTLRLMKLPPLVQRRVAAGVLSAGHARALLALEDPAEMERLAQRIVSEGLSVRAAEEAASLSKRATTTRRAAGQRQERHRERLDYIADAFADKLDTSVKINLGARKGRMTIEFASVDDLNRIISVLDPQADATES